ncbi:putative multi antimicrobial extrusion protein [Helianthus debilis subsp. tardiflorus]
MKCIFHTQITNIVSLTNYRRDHFHQWFCLPVKVACFVVRVDISFLLKNSVRVGNELGAGNPKAAAFSVLTVTTVSFLIALVEAMIVLSVRHVISYAFTGGETVAHAVSDLCPLLAITIILNGIQPVLSGVAVGCGWQAYVAYVNIGCYYFVGIPLGLLLGFHFNFGVKVPFITIRYINVSSKTGIRFVVS